jgi:hypothetical protein
VTRNPFEFSAANDLDVDQILDYYIEDFNYSRFIQSKRNIFLLGERGSGKTMTLLYNSFDAQRVKARREGRRVRLDRIGIYIPCNTPLTHRREHELLEAFKASTLSEHVLVLSIVHRIIRTLVSARDLLGEIPDDILCEELEAILAKSLPPGDSFLSRVERFIYSENQRTQQAVNRSTNDSFYEGALSFATLAMPLLEIVGRIELLGQSHFLLMLDDADYLNTYHIQALNAWIAYRDHSRFSFKVATAKVSRPSLITAAGGSILEGHDFTVVDMEKPLQNEQSDFGQLAHRIVKRRLERIECASSPEDFFPISSATTAQLEECKAIARQQALEKYPSGSSKQISDYVYKYHRALFFRREPRANLPAYTGFEMLVYLSTGVVRNLLEPCYWMYDRALSAATESGTDPQSITAIEPTHQNMVIMELSKRVWDQIEEGLDRQVAGCTREQAFQIRNLFEALARLFRERLLSDCSEPRATSFTISGRESGEAKDLEDLITIARKALLIYARSGPSKEAGSRETYYVPRRMLWPVRGLDPQGQHARVSLKARDLMAAARGERGLWTREAESSQEGLFDVDS